ncbi:helix-turn-helix domain-containing protein [Rhizobium jaguaris]|uniref:AraC family transcriptional regulator n=1 Tax=Rhizobium jaguaris TaxID=1312183 RepID=A0A387FV16_9HYPH|nr:AraC family transcriptional regulator [Rhizobium jaguaris]AYG59954.1 AraC family transcriptional regulator [Rhizobium jaguaris]
MNVVTRNTSPRAMVLPPSLGYVFSAPSDEYREICRHSGPTYQGATVEKRHAHSWDGVSASLDNVVAEGGYGVSLDSEHPVIVIVLEEVGGVLQLLDRASVPRHTAAEHGTISVVAAGAQVDIATKELRYLRLLTLSVDPSMFTRPVRDAVSFLNKTRLSFGDHDGLALAELIAEELRAPGVNDTLYLESLTSALLVALSRVDAQKTKPRYVRGGLAPTHLRRAQELMLQEDAQPLKLQDVAKELDISQAHLSRAFKMSTGQSPHQWLIERKIAKAKALLVEGEMALSEIALKLGFCDQAHFTRAFRKSTGLTPLAWQRL